MTEISHKRCPDCGEVKPLDEFHNQAKAKDGKYSYCKPCGRARRRAWEKANPERNAWHTRSSHLKREYGITVEQYDEMLESQDGCCAICGTSEPRGTGFHVDHSHESGEIRGILCHHCNTSLGGFNDNPELLQAAIEYLEVHNERKLDAA